MRQRPLGGVGTWFLAPKAGLGTVAYTRRCDGLGFGLGLAAAAVFERAKGPVGQ